MGFVLPAWVLRGYRPFLLWLAVFYAAWSLLVVAGGYLETVREHWPIALAMTFGSYIAGSTPMGGGTVGFPVLVLLFHEPASIGRNFGLAVQSIGMVSASLFILCGRIPLEWKLIRPALWGAAVGTPLGAIAVAPWLPDLSVKLIFAVIWASFGLMHFLRLGAFTSFQGLSDSWGQYDQRLGWTVGIVGGIVAAVTGVGIDMLLYSTLVLLYRADLKVAIPSSVIVMAATSVMGIACNALLGMLVPGVYGIQAEVFANWLAAAPVVAVGAPLGAWVVRLLPRTPTLLIVSGLCVLQFVWTCYQEAVKGWPLLGAVLAVLGTLVIFQALFLIGQRRAEKRRDLGVTGQFASPTPVGVDLAATSSDR